jgi:hypothetical protein
VTASSATHEFKKKSLLSKTISKKGAKTEKQKNKKERKKSKKQIQKLKQE